MIALYNVLLYYCRDCATISPEQKKGSIGPQSESKKPAEAIFVAKLCNPLLRVRAGQGYRTRIFLDKKAAGLDGDDRRRLLLVLSALKAMVQISILFSGLKVNRPGVNFV